MAKTSFHPGSQTKTMGGGKRPNPWAAGKAGGASLGNQGAVAKVKTAPPQRGKAR